MDRAVGSARGRDNAQPLRRVSAALAGILPLQLLAPGFPNELLKPYPVYGATPNSTDFSLLVEISR